MEKPTAGRSAGADRRRAVLAAAAAAAVLSGCSVEVREAGTPEPARTAAAPAAPTITPGHDAAAVAASDLPFAAGSTLAPGVPVGISDGLKDAPGWKQAMDEAAGERRYLKADGCLVSAKVRSNQSALAQGGDRESTAALFGYLDPTVLPGYLKTETLRWGGGQDAPDRRVEVLVLEQAPLPGGRAVAVLARLFATAGSSVYVSVSCPDAASLAAARADVAAFLPVLPPD